ncbi:hypothetical protein EVG20_g9920 [Dentipellis fragilis]|uniref:Uncharacterized protein n=1 Tax=Dentipellis fragilis TaxID=205917 RepID=A0A4Y9XV06_9AGAM|nr:hypothetical protein EVG20_g9920 [Dentipellis fragilis]
MQSSDPDGLSLNLGSIDFTCILARDGKRIRLDEVPIKAFLSLSMEFDIGVENADDVLFELTSDSLISLQISYPGYKVWPAVIALSPAERALLVSDQRCTYPYTRERLLRQICVIIRDFMEVAASVNYCARLSV